MVESDAIQFRNKVRCRCHGLSANLIAALLYQTTHLQHHLADEAFQWNQQECCHVFGNTSCLDVVHLYYNTLFCKGAKVFIKYFFQSCFYTLPHINA